MIHLPRTYLVAGSIAAGLLVIVLIASLAVRRLEHAKQPIVTTKTPAAPAQTTKETLTAPTPSTPAKTPAPATSSRPAATPSKPTAVKPNATPAPAPKPAPTPTAPAGTCANPYFTTSASNGGVTDGGYYVHNNLWNAGSYPGTTGTTQVCSYHSWNHIARATNSGDGAVKTYPNVHRDYSGRTVSSFTTLSSTFAATSPSVGIYNVAYDLWLNGVPNDEIMIWTDNYNQVPAGSKFASNISFSGHSWNIYATGSNGYIAFVPANGARISSGTLDIKAMLDYLVAHGRISAGATVDQIGYGVEIVDTGGVPASWYFTNFSITSN